MISTDGLRVFHEWQSLRDQCLEHKTRLAGISQRIMQLLVAVEETWQSFRDLLSEYRNIASLPLESMHELLIQGASRWQTLTNADAELHVLRDQMMELATQLHDKEDILGSKWKRLQSMGVERYGT